MSCESPTIDQIPYVGCCPLVATVFQSYQITSPRELPWLGVPIVDFNAKSRLQFVIDCLAAFVFPPVADPNDPRHWIHAPFIDIPQRCYDFDVGGPNQVGYENYAESSISWSHSLATSYFSYSVTKGKWEFATSTRVCLVEHYSKTIRTGVGPLGYVDEVVESSPVCRGYETGTDLTIDPASVDDLTGVIHIAGTPLSGAGSQYIVGETLKLRLWRNVSGAPSCCDF